MKRLSILLGFALLVFGAYLLWLEMQKASPHSPHVYLMAGMMALGCLLIAPAAIGEGLKQVVVVIGPYLPDVMIGGRRKTDPAEPPTVIEAPTMIEGRVELGDETGG